MEIVTSIVVQVILIALALIVTCLRCWIRLVKEHRVLTIPDYLVWGGWASAVGWTVCSIKALYLQLDHPLQGDELVTDSVQYLVTVFVASYFFDVGMFLPKFSLMTFYWWLIPAGFRRLRVAVYVGTAFVTASFIATLLTDTLIARPISSNWSIENQLDSLWNSYPAFISNWVLNFGTDLTLFCLPFFIINCLKLRRRQKFGLIGVFSLGLITMIISLARFIAYTVTDYGIDDASGNAWCTAEMCTAIIVVSLPNLKTLLIRPTPNNTTNRSTNGYLQADSIKLSDNRGANRSHAYRGDMDEEMELTFLERKPSPTPTTTTAETGTGPHDGKDSVMVRTDVTVVRESV